MRVHVLGVKKVNGKAKATGEDFEMANVIIRVPMENTSGKSFRVQGYGFDTAEMPLDPAALPQFASVPFPCELELQTDQRFFRNAFETICVGATVPKPMQAIKAG